MSTIKQVISLLVVFSCLADITQSVPNPCLKGPGATTNSKPILSACITAEGIAKDMNTDLIYPSSTKPPVGKPFVFSAGFYGDITSPSAMWKFNNQTMNRGNSCGFSLKPYGNYLQLYFGANTDYEIYAAMKCTAK